MRSAFAVVVAAVLAGCSDDSLVDERPGTGDPTYSLQGSFTAAATQAEMAELASKARDLGGDLHILESHPAGFHGSGLSGSGCDSLRAYADGRSYVADTSPCVLERTTQ